MEVAAPIDALDAYGQTAHFYDRLTAHHDYELWLGNLLPALRKESLRGNRLLDIACGTGKSFIPMLRRGWKVTGVDISPAMLEVARGKVGHAARLLAADMRALPRLGVFDLAWCLDDAVNYLEDQEDLVSALSCFRAQLRPGGLCLFDVNELAMYRTLYGGRSQVTDSEGAITIEGREAPGFSGGNASALLECRDREGGVLTSVLHVQRYFHEDAVSEAIAEAGLVRRQVFGHGFDAVLQQPLDPERHTKAVYIASREGG